MAVPKKKTSKGVTRRRHKHFLRQNVSRIKGMINLVKCPCGTQKMNHHACPSCGKYKGVKVIDNSKEIDKITTIKA